MVKYIIEQYKLVPYTDNLYITQNILTSQQYNANNINENYPLQGMPTFVSM